MGAHDKLTPEIPCNMYVVASVIEGGFEHMVTLKCG